MNELARFVGLDVGGTSMKAGVVDDGGKILSQLSLSTNPERGQEAGLETMAEAIRRAIELAGLSVDAITAIGVATPGLMDIPAGLIVDPPNLKPWKNVPVRERIAREFGRPTAFQNDANAAAYGEYWVGAGREVHSLVLFTLGTGIGGGIIIGDRILEGRHSHGGELGHMKIEMSHPRLCGCGFRGCLEAYASATAVVQRTVEALAGGEPSVLQQYRDTGEKLTSKLIFDTAATGDPLAERIVDQTAYFLAVGAANLMAVVDPDVIAFAGGMVAAGSGFLEQIRGHVRKIGLPIPVAKTDIRIAQLGSDAGLIGAAGCGRQLWLKMHP